MNEASSEHAMSAPLRRAADRLHVIISAPPGVLPEGRLREVLRHELISLRELLLSHFAAEEQGGYLSNLVDAKPDMARRAEELRAQHASLRDEFEALVGGADSMGLAELLERVATALETFDAHEHAEAQLLAGVP